MSGCIQSVISLGASFVSALRLMDKMHGGRARLSGLMVIYFQLGMELRVGPLLRVEGCSWACGMRP